MAALDRSTIARAATTYALIDPRDGHEIDYQEGRAAAIAKARWLESSAAHSYRAANVRLIVRKVGA